MHTQKQREHIVNPSEPHQVKETQVSQIKDTQLCPHPSFTEVSLRSGKLYIFSMPHVLINVNIVK